MSLKVIGLNLIVGMIIKANCKAYWAKSTSDSRSPKDFMLKSVTDTFNSLTIWVTIIWGHDCTLGEIGYQKIVICSK